MAKQKARLKDIAQKTGYGTNTVSLALRGSTRISAAAREKIAKAALELEYVPNHIAKSLVSRRSNTVGLILHEITNPILTSAAEKIQLTLASSGYGVLFATSNGNFEAELRAIEMFRSRMVDGLLIYPLLHAKLDHLKRLRQQNFPVVMLVGIEDSGIDAVGIDEYAGAYDATRHLIEEGHSRIGALMTPQYQTALKYNGYTAAMASAGLPIDRQIVGSCLTHSIEGGIRAMEHIMGVADPPTAIFASSDVLALGAPVLERHDQHGDFVGVQGDLVGGQFVENHRALRKGKAPRQPARSQTAADSQAGTGGRLTSDRCRDAGCAYASTLITTRRFCARPSRVLFGAIGLSSP